LIEQVKPPEPIMMARAVLFVCAVQDPPPKNVPWQGTVIYLCVYISGMATWGFLKSGDKRTASHRFFDAEKCA
jgi:hypothetical protein